MPAILSSAKGTRCARCATLIRNNRSRCPSCDLDFAAPEERSSDTITPARGSSPSRSAPASLEGSSGSARQKPRAAKAGAKLCPVCFNSVAEAEMGEANGQMVCAACVVSLKTKAAKAAAAKQQAAQDAAKEKKE